jgi:hypothetical protein
VTDGGSVVAGDWVVGGGACVVGGGGGGGGEGGGGAGAGGPGVSAAGGATSGASVAGDAARGVDVVDRSVVRVTSEPRTSTVAFFGRASSSARPRAAQARPPIAATIGTTSAASPNRFSRPA